MSCRFVCTRSGSVIGGGGKNAVRGELEVGWVVNEMRPEKDLKRGWRVYFSCTSDVNGNLCGTSRPVTGVTQIGRQKMSNNVIYGPENVT